MIDLCFIPSGDISNAGSRLRCYWPSRFLPNSVVATWNDIQAGNLPPARAYVFQKLVDVALMRELRERGARVFWDVCDPAWWFNPTDAREAADVADAVVVSSAGLVSDFGDWYGQTPRYIPDRLDLEHYNQRREHRDTRPVRLIWFGSAQNRVALYGAAAALSWLRANNHEVTLTIFDNAPDTPMRELEAELPVYYTRWSLEREVETLATHDIALLPPYPGVWGRVKSNNRTLAAWAAGLPVERGDNFQHLRALVCDAQLRREEAAEGLLAVQHAYRVEQSAAEWLMLIEEIEDGRTSEVHSQKAVQV